MAYEPRTFQSTTANTPPTGTDPMVDNTSNGDVQAIKLINPTAGSTAPWIDQAARSQSLPVALSTEDAQLLSSLLALLPAALVGGRLDVNVGNAVEIANDAGSPIPISGTVAVSNFPATQPVSGTVEIANDVGNPIPVTDLPATSGGIDTYRDINAGATGVVIKNSPGQIYEYYFYNAAAATRYIKLYNKATIPTTSDTPLRTLPLPAGAAANLYIGKGIAFAAGISIRATTGVADNDSGAPATNDVIVNIGYK